MALKTPTKSPELGRSPSPSAATPPPVLNLSQGAPSPPSPQSHTTQLSYDGVTCEFPTDPPQKFVCSICTGLVKDPHLTACCGQEFCQSCLEKWVNKSGADSCPHCRHEEFVHILDKQTRREVEELRVLCSKRAQGCTWQGELRVVKAHQRDCEYTPVKCHNCSMSVPQKNFEKHSTSECAFRDAKCVYCNKEDTYVNVISFIHLAVCPGYPMGCPNNCGATDIKRCNFTAHRDSCPLEEIRCPAGCPSKLLRKYLEAHVMANQTEHLLLLMTNFQKSQHELQTQRKELRELKMFKVTMSEAVERVSSSMDHLLRKSLTTDLVPLRSIRALLGSSGALVLDADHREISLVLPNFSQLEKKVTTSWESIPFFLGPGYKVCLAFVQRKSSNLAAEIHLLPGEFDDELSWPISIDFSNISICLPPVKGGIKGDAIWPSRTFQQSFDLSLKGKAYTGVSRCALGSHFHHILWQIEKVMDPLPPAPSAIRSLYLQNDCLTITLTWGAPRGSIASKTVFEKLSLKMQKSSINVENKGAGGRGEVVREGGIAVSTSIGGDTGTTGRIVRRHKRRK